MQKTSYQKDDIKNFVKSQILEKIEKLSNFIDFTIESSQDIKKTPKYDSIREEIQEEIYQMQKQLGTLIEMKSTLAKVMTSPLEDARLGAIVITNKARFYISISLGEFFYNGDRFYAISPESPMAMKMRGLKVGDSFTLNKIHQEIKEIF